MSAKKSITNDSISRFGGQFLSNLMNFFVLQETGKGLSSNDYTTNEKNKLAGMTDMTDAEVTAIINGTYPNLSQESENEDEDENNNTNGNE